MRASLYVYFVAGLVACAETNAFAAAPQAVQRSLLDFEKEYVAANGERDCEIRVGATIDAVPLSGKRVPAIEIVEIQPGKAKHTFRSLSVKGPKGARKKFLGSVLLQLQAKDRQFEVVFEPSTKTYMLLDDAKRDEVASERLARQRQRLWKEPTEKQAQSTIANHRKLFDKVAAAFPNNSFTLHETAYFLFYTDIPTEQVGGYIAQLDAMYLRLCQLFGVPPDTNIWLGKCAVVAFVEQETFQTFELQIQKNSPAETVAGLCHGSPDGRVLISCHRGKDPLFFGAMLVHETTHGFMHRFRSNVRTPSWLNEGIADWVADAVVPACDATRRKQTAALQQLRSTGSIGSEFFTPTIGNIPPGLYGVASSMTHFLLSQDPGRYCALLMAIKEGYTWKEALKLTFDVTPAELTEAYGRSIGLPGLRP